MNGFTETAAGWIFPILLNSLWEGAAIALAAAVVLRLVSRTNATTRASILAAALIASITLPVATTIASRPRATTPVAGVRHVAVQLPRVHTAARKVVVHAPSRTPSTPRVQSPGSPFFERVHVTVPRIVVGAIVIIWSAAALIALLRLGSSLLHLEHLKKDALPLDVAYRSRMERWTRAAKGGRGVRLCRSPEIVIPIAVGLFDAMILVPEALLEELSTEDVDRIVLHELAHLRRGDDWINAIERIAQALFFFSPGLLWIVGQLDLEREVVCDDWVLHETAETRQYATCLARVAEITAWPYRAMAAPGAFITRRSMSIRVERLLQAGRDVGIRTSLGPAGLALTTLAVLCIVAGVVAPSVAYPVNSQAAAAHSAVYHLNSSDRLQELPHLEKIARVEHTLPTAAPAKPNSMTFRQTTQTKIHVAVASKYEPRVQLHAIGSASVVPEYSTSPSIVAQASSGGYIDELAAAGYRNLSLDDLIKLKSLGVTGEYIRGLQSAGLPHPSIDELVQLAALGVDGAYVREMRRMFPNASPGDLSSLKAVGVSPGYVDELRANGLSGLSLDDVRSMRAVGVDPAYIRQMRARFPSASAGELRQMRAVGVTGEYIDSMRAAGFGQLSVSDATQMRALGIDGNYVRELRDAGYPNLTKSQISECRAVGIDGAFIRAAAAHGFKNLSIYQLVRLKESGIL